MKHPLVVNCQTDEYDVYVGRPSIYGNPFIIGIHGSRSEVVLLHREWLYGLRDAPKGELPPDENQIAALQGQRLGCWCGADEECHADSLAILANPRRGGLFRK